MTKMFHIQTAVRLAQMYLDWDEAEGKPQQAFTDTETGEPVSYEEARAFLRSLRGEGVELLPCCENLDERGRCLGT